MLITLGKYLIAEITVFILSYLHKKCKKKLKLFVKNVAQIIECIFGEFEAGAHLPTPGVSCVDKPGAIG